MYAEITQYENLLSAYEDIANGESALECEVCLWFGKTFSDAMYIGESLVKTTQRIESEAIAYLETLKSREDIEASENEAIKILKKLLEIIEPIKADVEKVNKRKLGSDKRKVKADICNIIKYTEWEYELKKEKKKYIFVPKKTTCNDISRF